MKCVGIRGSLVAAVASVFVLGAGVTTPTCAQQTSAAANPELAALGVWDPTVTYAIDDIVTARGSSWISLRNNNRNRVPGQTGNQSTAADWQLFARGFNPTGAWSDATRYQPDDLVTFNGQTFRAKLTHSARQPAPNQFWELFAARGVPGPNTGIGAGSASTPSISFDDDSDTGIFSPAPGKIALVENGALFLHNIGEQNTALGSGTLGVNTGAGNTAIGDGALAANTTGVNNVAVGAFALTDNTTGSNNAAFGSSALRANTTGEFNTAVGQQPLRSNTTGNRNVAVGFAALDENTTGSFNVAIGSSALADNTAGTDNTAVGAVALGANTIGIQNTALGRSALAANTTGGNNTALGFAALDSNTTGNGNTAIGFGTLGANTSGSTNIAIGDSALANSTTASFNTALGQLALGANSTGANNVAIGTSALDSSTAGNNNVAIGNGAGGNPTAPSNSIFIGNTGLAADTTTIKIGAQGTQTTAFMAGIRGATTAANDAVAVLISSTGQLGTTSSSRRYKTDIETMADVSAMLGKLRPVTFRYKQAQDGGAHPLQYGLIAEEVADVFPDLAVFNTDGSAETVKYHLLPSFLLAGYQAQQQTIAALNARDARRSEKIEALEQREQMQASTIASLEARLARLEALSQTRAAALR